MSPAAWIRDNADEPLLRSQGLVSDGNGQLSLFQPVAGNVIRGSARGLILLSPYAELLKDSSPGLCRANSSFQATFRFTQGTHVVKSQPDHEHQSLGPQTALDLELSGEFVHSHRLLFIL